MESGAKLLCKRCKVMFPATTHQSDKVFRCPRCRGLLIFAGEDITDTGDETRSLRNVTTEVPEEVRRAIIEKSKVVGQYLLLERIGAGGGGEVYRAFDLVLERTVALKIFSIETDIDLEKTRNEARLCGRLKHPGIPRIHEVASDKNLNYMVMEFIDGESLEKTRLDQKEIIKICRDAALILDYAHGAGIVHRDVKPSNIMVDKNGGVYLTDFGIARISGDDPNRKTKSGEIKGSPQFMSPEQATGRIREIDHRTDIYSLGATMYCLLTGRFPFDARSLYLLVTKICEEIAPAPGRVVPGIPRAIDAIIMKAMEKDKTKRYQNAKHLADDIDRFLKGEDVTATPPGTVRRILTKIKKHKEVTVIIGGILVIALSGYAGILWERQKRLEAEASASKAVSETSLMSKEAEILTGAFLNSLAGAHKKALELRMKGAKYRELQLIIEGTTERYNALMKLGIRDARVHYALGRLYRMAGDDSKAREQMENSLKIDPRSPETCYEMGILTYRLWTAHLEDVRNEWLRTAYENWKPGSEIVKRTRSELEEDEFKNAKPGLLTARQLRDESRRYIEAAAIGLPARSQQATVARGILAGIDARFTETKSLLWEIASELSRETYSTMHEDAVLFLATMFRNEEQYEREVEVLSRAIEVDTGNEAFYLQRAGANSALSEVKGHYENADPTKYYEAAMADLERMLDLHTDRLEALAGRGKVNNDWGIYVWDHGGDPTKLYAAAIADYNLIEELSPGNFEALIRRGHTRVNLGAVKHNRRINPLPDYEAALADFDNALKVPDITQQQKCEVLLRLGKLSAHMAHFKKISGEDPNPIRKSGLKYFDEAMKLNPGSYEVWLYRGELNMRMNKYDDAIKDYDQSLKLNESCYTALVGRGKCYSERGTDKISTGEDPTADFEKALADLKKAKKLCPTDFEAPLRIGDNYNSWGIYASLAGEDPAKYYELALADLDEAIALNPSNFEVWQRRGNVRGNLGIDLRNRGKNPLDEYMRAVEDYTKALDVNPGDDDILVRRGKTFSNIGTFAHMRMQNPMDGYGKAIADYEAAIRTNPRNYDAWLGRGVVYGSTIDAIKRGLAPGKAEGLYTKALADFDSALNLSPNNPEVYFRRGTCHFIAEHFREAVADFEKSADLNPNYVPMYRHWWDEAKRRIAGDY